MKLYNSIGPNPRIVRMFMAEKGIEMPKQTVDLRGGENRQAEHLKRNPHGQMPTLELDDGGYLSEITAICEYLEEKHPKPAMIGSTAEERAECRMWTGASISTSASRSANGYRFGVALKFFPEPRHLRPRSLRRPEEDRRQPAGMAQRPDGAARTISAARASRWRISCCTAGSISAARSASRWIRPIPISSAWFARVAERPSVKA